MSRAKIRLIFIAVWIIIATVLIGVFDVNPAIITLALVIQISAHVGFPDRT